MILRLTESQYRVVLGSCFDGYPDEACGLFIGTMSNGAPQVVEPAARAAPCRRLASTPIGGIIEPRSPSTTAYERNSYV